MVYWDADNRKDLLIGLADGTVEIFLNTASDDDPQFDGGTPLQVGDEGSRVDIDIGSRATPIAVDWNNDGRKDLVVGSSDARIHIFLNDGSDGAPDFRVEQFAQEDGADLEVPSVRSSPVVLDLDDDGMKDLLTGNTDGQLLFYSNVVSDTAPAFSGYLFVESDGDSIDLDGLARSRPFVCDWTGDGLLDVLIGSGDGLVRLYQGVESAGIEPEESHQTLRASGQLLQAYPNPFNPSMTICFELAGPEDVLMSVYDIHGRKVSTLSDRPCEAGRHNIVWQGKDYRGLRVPSGVYFIRFEAGGIRESRKVLLVR